MKHFPFPVLIAFSLFTAKAQTIPQPLQVVRVYNVTSASQVFDNRSTAAMGCNYFSYYVNSNVGAYTIQLEYSDVSRTGPWTPFPTSQITNTSFVPIGVGNGYHSWVRLNTLSGSTSSTLSCSKDYFITSSASSISAIADPGFNCIPFRSGPGMSRCATEADLPVTISPSGDTTGATDLANIQAAINAVSTNGYTIGMYPGTYYTNSTAQMGNGSASAASTTAGIKLACLGAGPGCIVNSLSSGPAFQINGPMDGWGISGINIVLSAPNAIGIEPVSATWGKVENVNISLFAANQIGIYETTNSATSGTGLSNTMHNKWTQVSIVMGTTATNAQGVYLTGYPTAYPPGPSSDACLEEYDNLTINAMLANQTGVHLQNTDSDQFFYFHQYNTNVGCLATAPCQNIIWFDYTGDPFFPSDVNFFSLTGGGQHRVYTTGTPSGATPNAIYGLGLTNGMQIPVYVANLNTLANENIIFNTNGNVVGTAGPGLEFITGIYQPYLNSAFPAGGQGAYDHFIGYSDNSASIPAGSKETVINSFNNLSLYRIIGESGSFAAPAFTSLFQFWSDGTAQFGLNVPKTSDTFTVGNNNPVSNVTMTVEMGGGQAATSIPGFRVVNPGTPFSLVTTSATASGATLQFSGGTTGVANGQYLSGPNIQAGSTVSSYTGTSVTMNNGVLLTGVSTGATIIFYPTPVNVFAVTAGGISVGTINIGQLASQPINTIARCSNCTVGSCLTVGSGAWVFFDGSGHYTCPIP